VKVALLLEKKETMLVGNFTLTGFVTSMCDRCNDVIEVPVKGNFRLVYKFGLEISDDESLIVFFLFKMINQIVQESFFNAYFLLFDRSLKDCFTTQSKTLTFKRTRFTIRFEWGTL
jgi:hypothetical protein